MVSCSLLKLFGQLLVSFSLFPRKQTICIRFCRKGSLIFSPIFYQIHWWWLMPIIRLWSGQIHSTPVDREGRKIDALRRKVFFSCSLGIKKTNYQAVIALYHFHLWERMAFFIQELPEHKRRLPHSVLLYE